MRRLNSLGFTKHEEVADWYSRKFEEMGGSWFVPDEELDEMLDMLEGEEALCDPVGKTFFLDLGCGDGKLASRAVERKWHVWAVDISPVAVAMTEKRLEGKEDVHVDLCAMEALPYPDRSFHYIMSYGSIEHALDIRAAVREMCRALKKNGRFLLYAPNEEWVHEDQPLETTMTANEWMAVLLEAGLTVDRIVKRGDNNIITGWRP